MSNTPVSPQRRSWLLVVLIGLINALGILPLMAYPVVRFLWPRKVTQSGSSSVTAPFRASELETTDNNPFNFNGKPCLVVRGSDGKLKAFNAICTHTDCTVGYRPEKGDIFCACHNGVYSLDGRNVSGPPPRPLESYKVVQREEEIIVSRS